MIHINKCDHPTASLLIVLFLFTSIISFAQNTGVVLDGKSKKPLMGVNIYSNIVGTLTVTNSGGEYTIRNLSQMSSNDTLFFSYIGYVTKKIPVNELKIMKFAVSLYEDIQLLKEVVIVSEKPQLQREIKFKKLASLKEGLYSFGSVLIGGKICIIGGDTSFGVDPVLKSLNEYGDDFMMHIKPAISWQEFSGHLYVYDLKLNKWVNSNLKFEKRAYNSLHYFHGKIYILGGKSLSKSGLTEYLDDKLEIYDIKKNSILVDHNNPHQAINFASFVYNDNLIVMGGSIKMKANGEKEFSDKVHFCNLKTGYWYESEDMPQGMETKGILTGNTIYLFGGFRNKPLKMIQTYNVITGKWNEEGVLPFEVERPGIAMNKNLIYIFENGKIQTYNIETKEVKVYLIDLALKSAELFYSDDLLYLLGGKVTDEYSVSPSSDLYSIDIHEFRKTDTYSVEDVK